MRLILDETLVTAPIVSPLTLGWLEPAAGVTIAASPGLSASEVDAADTALVSAAHLGHLQETHQVVPEVAVVAEGIGAVSLRTPVRPDEVEQTVVRVIGQGGIAELLARATLQPYFGIKATSWVTDGEAPDATAIVLEGVEALRPVEGGFAEDLCRAWFILTALPVVSHVLVAPIAATRAEVAPVLETLAVAASVGYARRREWRTPLIERDELDRDRVHAVLAGQRYELTGRDRQALVNLAQRGGRGSGYPPLTSLRFLEPEAGEPTG
jgi:predicted solute-binding protein